MSRSREITEYKRKIMSAILNNEDIINAIGEQGVTIDNADELINLCIFDYNRIPSVQEVARTYITIQVNVPRIEKGNVWREVVAVIRVIVHNDKMDLTGKGNRMDYISSLLDELFSGREDFGFGTMLITSNVEGAINEKFLARTMTYSVNDLNKVGCSK